MADDPGAVAAAAAITTGAAVAGDRVVVRMYRGILGDCFLIRHDNAEGSSHILIDCGVLQGVEGAKDRIVAIAEDVVKTCKGRLDLLVVTHEHFDHLSGFIHAADTFFGEGLTIGALWLAWTENPVDDRAVELRQKLAKARTALAMTLRLADGAGLAAMAPARLRDIATVRELAAFIGPDEADEAPPASPFAADGVPKPKKPRKTCAAAIEQLKAKAGPAGTSFLSPGQMLTTPVTNLRAYVLGPPRDAARMRKDRPSAGAAKEVYLTGYDEAQAVASAADAGLTHLKIEEARARGDARPDERLADQDRELAPFARPYCRSLASVKEAVARDHPADSVEERYCRSLASPFAPAAVDHPAETVEELYFHSGEDNRTIDGDWLEAAGALALKLDSDTNNTSLVLAFELPDGQVLLFPGDAQVGNWLSWHDQTYSREASQGDATALTADDLLRRVTLYKVGHHASHNATLREQGLEKMTDPRLVAMIPVVEAVAANQGKGWKMPYGDLYAALQRRTGNCVVRGDGAPEAEAAAFAKRAGGTAPIVTPALDYGEDNLWVQITIQSR